MGIRDMTTTTTRNTDFQDNTIKDEDIYQENTDPSAEYVMRQSKEIEHQTKGQRHRMERNENCKEATDSQSSVGDRIHAGMHVFLDSALELKENLQSEYCRHKTESFVKKHPEVVNQHN